MAYKIRYLPLAVADLDALAAYLSGFYPATACRVLGELEGKIFRLGETPRMCELYAPDPFYRRLTAGDYLVFYHVNEEQRCVEIHRVLRGSWNLPNYLE